MDTGVRACQLAARTFHGKGWNSKDALALFISVLFQTLQPNEPRLLAAGEATYSGCVGIAKRWNRGDILPCPPSRNTTGFTSSQCHVRHP